MKISKIRIEKFDGSDFIFWKMQIEDFLYQKRSSRTSVGGEAGYYDHKAMEAQGSSGLRVDRLMLSKNVTFNIIKEKTTSDLLKALSNMYEKPSSMNKVYLM